jgi:hypothetical protein
VVLPQVQNRFLEFPLSTEIDFNNSEVPLIADKKISIE